MVLFLHVLFSFFFQRRSLIVVWSVRLGHSLITRQRPPHVVAVILANSPIPQLLSVRAARRANIVPMALMSALTVPSAPFLSIQVQAHAQPAVLENMLVIKTYIPFFMSMHSLSAFEHMLFFNIMFLLLIQPWLG